MKSVKLISEDLIRINHIIKQVISEAPTMGGAPWYIRLIDELGVELRTAGKSVPTTTLDFLKTKLRNAGNNQDEIDDAVRILFNKRSGFYDDLINLIRRNYATKINQAVDDIAQFGQDLLNSGMPLADVHREMDNYYRLATQNSFLGDDLALEIQLDARNKLRQPTGSRNTNTSSLTAVEEADLQRIFDTYKNNKAYRRLFDNYGPQMEAEFNQLKVVFSKSKDLADFSRRLDEAFIKWQKAHPEVPSGFWPAAKKILTKMFIVRSKGGGISPMSIVKTVGWLLLGAWAYRGIQHKLWGDSWMRAFFKSTFEDAVGVVGGTIEGGSELLKFIFPQPEDSKTPNENPNDPLGIGVN